MSRTILSILIVLLFTSSSYAQTICQTINENGRLNSKKEFAESTNRMFKSKGIKLKITANDVETRVLNFCKNAPYGNDKDISDHFMQIADILAAADM